MLSDYKNWCFDFDGVILDSNGVKHASFLQVCQKYEPEHADAMLEVFKSNSGKSRSKIVEMAESDVVGRPINKEAIIQEYSVLADKLTEQCNETTGLRDFLDAIPNDCNRFIVTGSGQIKTTQMLGERGLLSYFDTVYGAPASKVDAFANLQVRGFLDEPTVFVGDSRYDYESSAGFDVDFVFMSDFTAFDNWKPFFDDKDCKVIRCLEDLM